MLNTLCHVTECSSVRSSISDSIILTFINFLAELMSRYLFSKRTLPIITVVTDLERKEQEMCRTNLLFKKPNKQTPNFRS